MMDTQGSMHACIHTRTHLERARGRHGRRQRVGEEDKGERLHLVLHHRPVPLRPGPKPAEAEEGPPHEHQPEGGQLKVAGEGDEHQSVLRRGVVAAVDPALEVGEPVGEELLKLGWEIDDRI